MCKVTSEFGPQLIGYGNGYLFLGLVYAVDRLILHNLRDPGIVIELFIKGPFVIDPEADQHGDRHPDRQTADIYKRRRRIFAEAAPGYFKMVFEHAFLFWKTTELQPEKCQLACTLLINWLNHRFIKNCPISHTTVSVLNLILPRPEKTIHGAINESRF